MHAWAAVSSKAGTADASRTGAADAPDARWGSETEPAGAQDALPFGDPAILFPWLMGRGCSWAVRAAGLGSIGLI